VNKEIKKRRYVNVKREGRRKEGRCESKKKGGEKTRIKVKKGGRCERE